MSNKDLIQDFISEKIYEELKIKMHADMHKIFVQEMDEFAKNYIINDVNSVYKSQTNYYYNPVVLPYVPIYIPPREVADNLILFLSTGQKVKGYFNYQTYKFHAHKVSKNPTPFALENLEIHDFVEKWEAVAEPYMENEIIKIDKYTYNPNSILSQTI